MLVKKNRSAIGVANHHAEITFGHVEAQAEVKIQPQVANTYIAGNFGVENFIRRQLKQSLYVLKKESLLKIFWRLVGLSFLSYKLDINFPVVVNVFRAEKMFLHEGSS